ncbi:MAG: tyrosine-type recombinase/integrase [Desulfatibacillum sp.]|nr:tyrosine-type recombinase/integrase [Desulfatibacillum sp.]
MQPIPLFVTRIETWLCPPSRHSKAVLKKAGLREIRLHDTRHTYASLLLSDRANLTYVKEQLGHSSIQMTVDVYGHLIPGSNRESVNRLDDPDFGTQVTPRWHTENTNATQPIKIAGHSVCVAPKAGLEPARP